MNTCAICQSELKFIPAGVSKKTGRPYQGFYACPNKCQQPRQALPQTPVQRFNQSLDHDNNDLKWKKINEEKEKNIRWCNAINNASLLIAHNPVQGSTDQDIVNRLYMLALRIDSLEPKAPQTHAVAPISRVTQQGEEYAIPPTTRVLTQNNEEVPIGEIPF